MNSKRTSKSKPPRKARKDGVRVHRFCRKLLSITDTDTTVDISKIIKYKVNYTIINSSTIKDKNTRYREYCKRLYQDNDEATSHIWKWKNDTYNNITDLSVAELKGLSQIDLSFLLSPKRAPH